MLIRRLRSFKNKKKKRGQKNISREKKGEEFISSFWYNLIREFSSEEEEEDAFEEDTQTAAQRAIVVFKEPH